MRGGDKPLDRGTGVICASFGSGGEWLSLGRAHPTAGFVELSGAPPFDESWRGQRELVRRYRAGLATDGSAYLQLAGVAEGVRLVAGVETAAGSDSIEQRLRLRRPVGAESGTLRLLFAGRLGRPALAMITEAATPQPAPPTANLLSASGSELRLLAPELASEATVSVEAGQAVLPDDGWRVEGERAEFRLAWPAEEVELAFVVRCRLLVGGPAPVAGPAGEAAGRLPEPVAGRLPQPVAGVHVPSELRPALERIHRGALASVRGCTALRVAPGRVAILTDHRLLPLSWTRDAYFQALLLLRAGDTDRVADHLRWLWLDCRRPNGWWGRSHHADGRRKDEVYQVDQQLYPLLELADYKRATGRLPDLRDGPSAAGGWNELVGEVVEGLLDRLSDTGLLATDENAADDPAGLPYLLANQILAWHSLRRLAELSAVLPAVAGREEVGERLRRSTLSRFRLPGPTGELWAYAVGSGGESQLYHDANDVATALAPAWGFCSVADPAWLATMDFAFSSHNPAYAAGHYGGLGSDHTPGVWPLGLAQEWLARSLAGHHAAAARALRRLTACAFSDWSLPEASDPATGRALARHWFAWPGALVSALLPDEPA